jgi:hypothetical protein
LKYEVLNGGACTQNIGAGYVGYGGTDPAEVTAVYNNLNPATSGNFSLSLVESDIYMWYEIARNP